jgi:hypothetical protein
MPVEPCGRPLVTRLHHRVRDGGLCDGAEHSRLLRSAEALDERGLVRFRLTVDIVGIDDRAEQRVVLGEDR